MADLAARGAVGGRSGAAAAAVALGRMCVRTFGASAAAALPAVPAGGANVAQTFLQKLGASLWPPKRGHYPYYIVSAILMYLGLYFSHVRNVRTREAEEEDRRKREYALISMKHMVEYEDTRERVEAAKAAAAAGAEKGETSEKDDKEQAADAKKMKTLKPADAKKLFDLLHDHVESAPITKIGVDSDDEMYVRLKELLGRRTTEELVNETTRTRKSREGGAVTMDVDEYEDAVGKYAARDYYDGQRLIKKVKFAKDSLRKQAGSHLVRALVLADLLADQEHALISRHLIVDGGVERVAHRHL